MRPVHFTFYIIVFVTLCAVANTTSENKNEYRQNQKTISSFEYEYKRFFTTNTYDGSENKYIPYDNIIKAMAFPQTSDANYFVKAVDYAMKFYSKNAVEMHYFAGAAAVIIAVQDSIHDINAVNDLKGKVSYDFTALARGEISLAYYEQSLVNHQKTIADLKYTQLLKGGLKGLFAGVLAYLGWNSENPIHQTAYYIGSSVTALSAAAHGFNYYRLDALLERIQTDGILSSKLKADPRAEKEL